MNLSFVYALKAREVVTETPKNYFSEAISVAPEDGFGGSYVYPDAVSETEFHLGTITTATFLYLYSDIDVEVYLGDPAVVTPVSTNFLVVNTSELSNGFTELHIKNNNGEGTSANVDIYVAGDIPA